MHRRALALLMTLAGCEAPNSDGDDTETSATESETGNPAPVDSLDASPMPDIDLDDLCAEVDSPALSMIDANHIELFTIGPCGHTVSESQVDGSTQFWLTMPDGSREPVNLPSQGFDETGQLLVLYDEWMPTLELHDLAAGTVDTFETGLGFSHGFIRSADPEHPTVAWLCNMNEGRLFTVTTDQTTEHMAGIEHCEAVLGSPGNDKLLFPRDEQLFVVDVDTGEHLATGIDFLTHMDPNTGVDYADQIRINYAGTLAIHEVIVGYPSEHDYDYQTIEERVIDLAHGEVVADCSHAQLLQGPTEHAPAFVRCFNDMFVWHEGELVQLNATSIIHAEVASSGTLVFDESDDEDIEVFRVSADTPTEVELIMIVQSGRPEFSASGNAIVHSEETEICADAGCTEYLHEFHQWSVDAGLGQPILSAGQLEMPLVFDDASVMAWGALVDGPVDPLPEPALLWIDADGQLVQQWTFGVDELLELRQLADGRIFFTTIDPDTTMIRVWTLDLAAPNAAPTLVLGPIDSGQPQLDGQHRRIALEADTELYWGAF